MKSVQLKLTNNFQLVKDLSTDTKNLNKKIGTRKNIYLSLIYYSNNDVLIDILRFFHEGDKKIDNIKMVQSMLLDLISNSDFKITNNEIKSLMSLCEVDIGKAVKVCANFCRIKKNEFRNIIIL